MSDDNAFQWKETGGPVCPGCGRKEFINQYGHVQWGCSSWWVNDEKTWFNQSDHCQRYEFDTIRKSIEDVRSELENHKKEQKRQDALIYQAPCGQRLKD